MHKIINQSLDKKESSEKPFHWVIYDLISMTRAMNNYEWVSHFVCLENDFNLIFTHKSKDNATEIITKVLNLIRTRYQGQVVFFWTDDEKSLSGEFHDFINSLDIIYEPSSPNTPDQNEHSEKKGHLLTMKARALCIETNLLIYLWPWAMHAACYLLNRTPMKKHK